MWPIRSGKDYLSVAEGIKLTVENFADWRQRHITPRWHGWFVGPTYPLTEQLWRDLKRMFPKELMVGRPNETKMQIKLIEDGLIEMKSADDPERLVSVGLDFVHGTECALWKPDVWEDSLRGRLSSPGRPPGRALLNSTPRGQTVGLELHWFWHMVLQGKNPEKWKELRSWYWYETGKPHPLISQEELEKVKNDPTVSERMFRQNYLGECLPSVEGKPICPRFTPAIHVSDRVVFNPAYPLYRSWDFGRNYPVVTFHQFYRDEPWAILAEICPFKQDLIDEELGYLVDEFTQTHFPNAKCYDYGDFEGNQRQDSRRQTTIEVMRRRYNIVIVSSPTRKGDERMAIDILNSRLKVRNDGQPGILIHPRCIMTIQGFSGGWYYATGKTGEVSWIREEVAETHPAIDIFDSVKYFINHVVRPQTISDYSFDKSEEEEDLVRTDPWTGSPIAR